VLAGFIDIVRSHAASAVAQSAAPAV
jgi:hypothetical protein